MLRCERCVDVKWGDGGSFLPSSFYISHEPPTHPSVNSSFSRLVIHTILLQEKNTD
jgi:hypothetical protein